eukprot:543482_1
MYSHSLDIEPGASVLHTISCLDNDLHDNVHNEKVEYSGTEITNTISDPSINSISGPSINSISGPAKGSSLYAVFIITLTVMIICGSCNDFLGKLIYQMFPGNDHTLHGIDALKAEYWITFSLTFASFFICSAAIFTKSASESYNKLNTKLVIKIFIPSIMDFFITGGRYLGLVFLSGAVVSILKNGTQLLFLAFLRRCLHHKTLKGSQLFGIIITIIGLLTVAAENIAITYTNDMTEGSENTLKDSVIGIGIMLAVGFAGAVRNDLEELLLKNDNLDSDFVVGMESIISLLATLIIGVILFIWDPFDNIGDKTNVFQNIYNKIVIAPGLIICFGLFVMAVYGKDTMQMKMTSLSSSLTRKLFQQIYPSVTWIISLSAFQISFYFLHSQYKIGENWEGTYSYIRLSGFMIVLIGNCFYIKGYQFFIKYFTCSNWNLKQKERKLKKNMDVSINKIYEYDTRCMAKEQNIQNMQDNTEDSESLSVF